MMSDQLLEKFTEQYINSQTQNEIMFTWHGGEALLRPISFYKKALELQKKYGRGRYSSKQLVSNIVVLPYYTIDLGLQRKILKDQGTIKIAVSDIFKTANGGAYVKSESVDIDVMNKWDSRRLNISFNYRFGKDDFKTRANRSTSSSEEQNRSSK
jgi:hypothetical protein